MTTLKVIEKSVCGRKRYYADCPLSHAILAIAGHKAFMKDNIIALLKAGLHVDVEDISGERFVYPPNSVNL